MVKNHSENTYETKKIKYYDLTAPITANTVVYPGDPQFRTEDVCSLDNGSQFHLCHMHFGNHTGTHIDFPAHVVKGGKTSSDFQIQDLIGSGLIIEVPETDKCIISLYKNGAMVKKHH